ncbi:P3 protein-like [Pollicipes pollicipes]|uniref:P3 protein-like n=1 Tax=Pollicipes pollicipes TaxID=41117 RepID=UPI0018851ADD|nr:P3 protein-like [Pollicipes pollicipes]
MQTDVELIKKELQKPVGPTVGFLGQFICMPLVAYTVARLGYPHEPFYQLGAFVIGICPGGSGSNMWTVLFRGDYNLSSTMTFVSNVAANAMMPLWLYTLGLTLSAGSEDISIPFSGLLRALAAMVIPYAAGILLRRARPHWKKHSEVILVPLTLCSVIFIVSVTVFLNLELFQLMDYRHLLFPAVVATSGALLATGLAVAFQLPMKQVVTIALETAIQNASIGVVLVDESLPSPDGDMVKVPIMAQFFLTFIMCAAALIVFESVRRCRLRCAKNRALGEQTLVGQFRHQDDPNVLLNSELEDLKQPLQLEAA